MSWSTAAYWMHVQKLVTWNAPRKSLRGLLVVFARWIQEHEPSALLTYATSQFWPDIHQFHNMDQVPSCKLHGLLLVSSG